MSSRSTVVVILVLVAAAVLGGTAGLLAGGARSPAGSLVTTDGSPRAQPTKIAWPATPPPLGRNTAVVPAVPAPPLLLTDQDGQPFELGSLRGGPVLVFFGYTHCPDVCPTTLADVRDVLRARPDVRAVFVSVDPARDTPRALKEYLSWYRVPIVGLTGTENEIRAAADAWGVQYARIDSDSASGYAMAHTADTFMLDANGYLRHRIFFGAGSAVFLDRLGKLGEPVATAAPPPVPTGAPVGGTPGPSAAPTTPAGPAPSPTSGPAAGASPDGSPAPGTSAPTVRPAASPAPGLTSGLIASLVSSIVREGRNRLVVAIANDAGIAINRPENVVTLRFRPSDRPGDPPILASTTFVWTSVGARGAYVADVTFPSAGSWIATVSAVGPNGPIGNTTIPIGVKASAPTPGIGDAAPSVDTPTSADVGGNLTIISSDIFPDERLYRWSVADLLAAGRPFVLTFYSPAFCPTTACGPLMKNLKKLIDEFPGFDFVHAEPYLMRDYGGYIRPEIVNGGFAWAPWAQAYGIPVEPWVFVVDAGGRVAGSFEIIVGTDELRAAIRAASGGSPAGG